MQNTFAGTSVIRLIHSLAPGTDYDTVKAEVHKTFSFTVNDYQQKLRNSKEGNKSFRQYYLRLSHYIDHWLKLLSQQVCL